MIFDLSGDLKTLEGESIPVKVKRAGVECDSTLGFQKVIVDAVLNKGDQGNLNGEEQVKRFQLAKRIYSKSKVELTHEDCVLIKTQVAASWPPLITGQVFELLEEKAEAKVDKVKTK